MSSDSSLEKNNAKTVLLNYIKSRLNKTNFIKPYLLSGPAKSANLNGALTPDLFYKHFFVSRPDEEEAKFSSTLSDLFDDTAHNMLCVQSTGGSGKSTFINTISSRAKTSFRCEYVPVDFEKATKPAECPIGEDELFRAFRKKYAKMCALSSKESWRVNFSKKLNELCSFLESVDSTVEYQDLIDAISIVTSPAGDGEEKIDAWFNGHSRRAHSVEYNDFKIILFLLLMVLYTNPDANSSKFVILFDNVEVYASPRAITVGKIICSIHEYETSLFSMLNLDDEYFTRFCFVFSVRTVTSLSIKDYLSRHKRDLFGYRGKYVLTLDGFDFFLEACLKKLQFLCKEFKKEYANSVLYKGVYSVISTILAPSKIECYLKSPSSEEAEIKDFAKLKLMPFFNNNYRNVVSLLAEFADNSNPYYSNIGDIEKRISQNACDYRIAINGIRMILFRDIFDELRSKGVLSSFGYVDLENDAGSRISRTLINFLYWKEIEHKFLRPKEIFAGVPLADVLKMLIHYCSNDCAYMSKILYNLSLLTGEDAQKGYLLEEWAYLIEFKDFDISHTLQGLREIVEGYFNNDESAFEKAAECTLKLSPAGKSFADWWSKQFEFFSARCLGDNKPLFAYCEDEITDAIKACEAVHKVIEKGIPRLIDECSTQCFYIGNKESKYCSFKECENNESSLLACSLFERYQEFLAIVSSCIDYIDRYRYYMRQIISNNREFSSLEPIVKAKVETVDNKLLDMIAEFNKLYVKLYDAVKLKFTKSNQEDSFGIFIDRVHSLTTEINNELRDNVTHPYLYYFDSADKLSNAISVARSTRAIESLYSINKRLIASMPCTTTPK